MAELVAACIHRVELLEELLLQGHTELQLHPQVKSPLTRQEVAVVMTLLLDDASPDWFRWSRVSA